MKPRILALLLLALLTACASKIEPVKTAALQYGDLPADWQAEVKGWAGKALKDPYSAVYDFGKPFQGYTRKAPIGGGGIDKVGWIVPFAVNAKNSFGGYTGSKSYQVILSNGTVSEVVRNVYFSEPWLKGSFSYPQ